MIYTLFSDSKQKVDHFNNIFASQCTTFVNNSKIPDLQLYKTNLRLLLNFKNDDILMLIRSLNIHETHGLDEISVCMIKTYIWFKYCKASFVDLRRLPIIAIFSQTSGRNQRFVLFAIKWQTNN